MSLPSCGRLSGLVPFFTLLLSATADAQESAASAASTISHGDNAWVLASSALVLMMTAPGLALFYGGLVRQKNVLATMMQSLFLISVVSMLWFVFGYSLAFGEGNAFFGNPLQYLFLRGVGGAPNPDYAATIPQQTFMIYQMMFAVITPALITGRVRGADEVRRFSGSDDRLDDARLFPSGAHGLGEGRHL